MRANPVTRLLALALVLMMPLSMPALADGCALCGKETGSQTYLCANCLLDLLAEKDIAGGLEIVGTVVNEDGSVTFSWNDQANNGPYSVYYEFLESAPVAFGWTAGQNISGSSFTLTKLVPGMSYVFTVVDASGNKAEHIFYAPALENGNEIGAKFYIYPKVRQDDRTRTRTFYASEILADASVEHGLYMKLTYSMLKRTRNYAFCFTVEAPNGFSDVVFSGSLKLNYGKSEVPAWGFIPLDDYFSYLERYYGGIPTGRYQVSLYFDGKHVYTTPLIVKE